MNKVSAVNDITARALPLLLKRFAGNAKHQINPDFFKSKLSTVLQRRGFTHRNTLDRDQAQIALSKRLSSVKRIKPELFEQYSSIMADIGKKNTARELEMGQFTKKSSSEAVGSIDDIVTLLKQLYSKKPMSSPAMAMQLKGMIPTESSSAKFSALKEVLHGGEADNIPNKAFPKDKLEEGAEEELEHTDNKQVAKEIAKDHLSEDLNYYTKLEKIVEKDAGWLTKVVGTLGKADHPGQQLIKFDHEYAQVAKKKPLTDKLKKVLPKKKYRRYSRDSELKRYSGREDSGSGYNVGD